MINKLNSNLCVIINILLFKNNKNYPKSQFLYLNSINLLKRAYVPVPYAPIPALSKKRDAQPCVSTITFSTDISAGPFRFEDRILNDRPLFGFISQLNKNFSSVNKPFRGNKVPVNVEDKFIA